MEFKNELAHKMMEILSRVQRHLTLEDLASLQQAAKELERLSGGESERISEARPVDRRITKDH